MYIKAQIYLNDKIKRLEVNKIGKKLIEVVLYISECLKYRLMDLL